ncbi:MAG: glycosyltransferase 87 family protein [Actinomycetes bacterium]
MRARSRRVEAALLAAAVAVALTAAPASGARSVATVVDSQRAQSTAERLPKVKAEVARHADGHWDTVRQRERWRVQYWTAGGQLAAEVFIAAKGGKVLEQWVGYQAAWSMARGYPGAFGRSAAALWIWLPLLAAFLIGLLPRGRPGLAWLDVAAVGALSLSFAGFNDGRIDLSTPLMYPPMLWLLGRMLWRGLRSGEPGEPRRSLLPASVMVIGIVFLLGFRIALVVADGNVIDVGEASVIGGDRLASGKLVYGHFPKRIERGDTYGPVTWAAYAPFALLFDTTSNKQRLAAATTAAVVFDILCLLALALLGYRLRGPPGAVVAAWFWVTCPFTLYVAMCGANDGLVALCSTLLLLTLTVNGTGGTFLRGAASTVQALTKMAGLVLMPMFIRVRGSSNLKSVVLWGLGAALLFAISMAPYVDDPLAVWRRTIGYQDDRGAPFSAWGLYGLPGWSRIAWQVAVVLLAVFVAIRPRAENRTPVVLASLSVAVTIALQLSAVYWFYTYIVWFLPAMALVAASDLKCDAISLSRRDEAPDRSAPDPSPTPA